MEKEQETNKNKGQQIQEKKEKEQEEEKKDPETISQGERMGFSKQQLRKLEKKLKKKEKDLAKEEVKVKQEQKAKSKGGDKEKKGKNVKNQQIDEEHRHQFLRQKIKLQSNKKLPAEKEQNILITSALPYVNNVPHLGNIIGCVLSADVYSRFMKLQGANVLYICGTDEYGTATEVKAMEQNCTPKQICDKYHAIHRSIYEWFDINFDYFDRTSTQWHSRIVQNLYLEIKKQGKTSVEQMTQCYCQKCDLFLADRFIVGTCPNVQCKSTEARGDQCDICGKLFNTPIQLVNYVCSICKHSPVIKSTRHVFLNLPILQDQISEWVKQASKEWSSNSVGITNSWLGMGLKSKCITRDLKWGVAVPDQQLKGKVFYVWFDAPIGYISITAQLLGEDYLAWWQAEESKKVKLYQFMGKDNVPFHTVIFPASLIASQQPWILLHSLSTTEYLTYQGGKFSKSQNRGVFGSQAKELERDLPAEVWRYYLLVSRPQHSDSDFSWGDLAMRNNNQLLANLGNLVHRVLQFIYYKCEGKIPVLKRDDLKQQDIDLIVQLKNRYLKYREILRRVQIKDGLKFCMEVSSQGNKYLQNSQFWEEQNRKEGRTSLVLNIISNFIRFQSFLIEPFMPSTSAKINWLLGLEKRTKKDELLGKIINDDPESFMEIFLTLIQNSSGVKQPLPLFGIIGDDQVNEWREKFNGKHQE